MSIQFSNPIDFYAIPRNNRQAVASYGKSLTDLTLGTGFETYNFGFSRKLIRFHADCWGVRFRFSNWHSVALANEAVGSNDIVVSAALELTSPAVASLPLTFGGKRSVTIEPGGDAWSDPVGIDQIKGNTAYVRTHVAVALGASYPVCNFFLANGGDRAYQSASDMSSLLAATGAPALPGGARSTPTGNAFGPTAIDGLAKSPGPTAGLFGDSIVEGYGESNTAGDGIGNFGWLGRGLHAAGIPSLNCGRYSERGTTNAGLGGYRRRMICSLVSNAVDEYGTNEIAASGMLLATVQAAAISRWTSYKRAGVRKVFAATILPRTNASNVPIAGFEVGGVRDQYNAWLLTQVGQGLLDGVVDPCPYVEDPADHGKWQAAFLPGDGIHPTAAGHIACSAAVAVIVPLMVA